MLNFTKNFDIWIKNADACHFSSAVKFYTVDVLVQYQLLANPFFVKKKIFFAFASPNRRSINRKHDSGNSELAVLYSFLLIAKFILNFQRLGSA